MKGHLEVIKLYADGTEEVHFSEDNVITSGMGHTLLKAFATSGAGSIAPFQITYFQLGSGSGYGYGYGYGGGHHPGTTGGGVFAAGAAQRYWGPGKARRSTGAPLAEALAYKQRNPVKPENIKMYTQSLVNANRGGIMNTGR